MEINHILTVAALTTLMMAVVGFLMFLMSRLRNDRYDMELKKIQLDVLRKSLEGKAYDANAQLLADPKRWKDVNHLLIEALRGQDSSNELTTGNRPNTFLESFGVNVDEIAQSRKRVFVLTPFHPRYDKTYQAIKGACQKLGLECMRGDEEFRPGNVLSHILELMAGASIVIANIDGRNANVYYELGIAHALGKKTILVASSLSKVPFDMQSQRIVLFSSVDELAEKLTPFLIKKYVDG